MWFLAGMFGGGVTRTINQGGELNGKHSFFPIINAVNIRTKPEETEQKLDEGVAFNLD